jgi:L-asparaginase II
MVARVITQGVLDRYGVESREMAYVFNSSNGYGAGVQGR